MCQSLKPRREAGCFNFQRGTRHNHCFFCFFLGTGPGLSIRRG